MHGMRVRALTLLIVLLACAAQADPPPMAGAGVLERNGRTDCSAVLIAPDLIATAAHCLGKKKLASQGGDFSVVFRTGAYPGHMSRDFEVVQTVLHPLHAVDKALKGNGIGADVALARLAEPVPSEIARPLPPGDPIRSDPSVLLASWPGGGGARARERRCPVLEVGDTVAMLSCVVIPGESGGAVVRLSDTGPELVAILVATGRSGHQPFGFAVHAQSRITQLKAIHGF